MARGLHAIRKAGEAAAALTRGLLAFGHPAGEAGRVPVDRSLDDLAPMLGALLGGTIQLRVRPGAAGAAALLEGGRMEEILLALCARAKEDLPRGGTVSLATGTAASAEGAAFTHLAPAAPGPFVVLSVRDNGAGMPAEALERVFEPYSAAGKDSGAGHALASVYGLVRRAGGGISAESRPGEGSVFRVWLPLAGSPASEAERGAAPAAPEGAGRGEEVGAPGPSARTVLVVEDDPALRDMLRAVFERYGYAVLGAAGSGEAEETVAAMAAPPDLVVSDVLLHDGLGTEMGSRLRAARPSLRLLFISGHSLDTLADQGIHVLPEEFLEKPFTPARLADRARELLAAPVPRAR
jgi:hypothetical protein